MDKKGDEKTAAAGTAAEELVTALSPLGDVSARAMFGGYGVFADGIMFALVTPDGTPHLRVGDANRETFAQRHTPKHGRMPYHAIPADVRREDDVLLTWAREALEAARAAR